MKICILNTAPGRVVGYGEAFYHIKRSLKQLDIPIVPYDEAGVKLWFCWPHNYRPQDPGYHIAYLPWESTQLKEGWVDQLNAMDEVWTTSPWCEQVFRNAGIEKPIYVYQHAVDDAWQPQKRTPSNRLRFYHEGGECFRKGGFDVIKAFNAAFPGDDDVSLTMKMYSHHWNIPKIGRVNVINKNLTPAGMRELYYDHHVMVYPSYGEGFGLIPLQGICSGMPTICTGAWAAYERFIQYPLDSTPIESPWPGHPGEVFKPDFDEIVDHMRYIKDNYELVAALAYTNGHIAKRNYEWVKLSAPVFKNLRNRLEKS